MAHHAKRFRTWMPGTGLARKYAAPIRFIWSRLLPALQPLLRRFTTVVRSPAESWRGLEPGRDFGSFLVPPLVSLHNAASGAGEAER